MNQEEQNQEHEEKLYTPEEREEYIADLKKHIEGKKPVAKHRPVPKVVRYIVMASIIFVVVVFAIIGIATSGSSPSSAPADEPQQEENLYGLSKATRMEIFRELILCEDEANEVATRHYFLGCESCPEFIEADLVKYMDEFNELVGNCKVLVWNKYNITEDMALNIVVEGIENKWIMPEVSLPDCCGSISESTVIFDPITITGSGSEKSAPFTVTTSEWIIEWEYEPEPEYSDMAVIGFFIYPRGETTMGIEAIVPGSETSGSSYSYAGPGDYYVDVQAAGVLSWKIQIKPA